MEAARVEWAVKIFVSIPADDKTSLTHRRIVSLEAGWYGFLVVSQSFVELPRIGFVTLMY